jgi:hypothetical protein
MKVKSRFLLKIGIVREKNEINSENPFFSCYGHFLRIFKSDAKIIIVWR